jgi:hypothetical protein
MVSFFIQSVSFASECRPVIFKGEELFCIKQSIGSYSPQERSNTIVQRLDHIIKGWNPSKDKIKVMAQDKIIYLGHEDTMIFVTFSIAL